MAADTYVPGQPPRPYLRPEDLIQKPRGVRFGEWLGTALARGMKDFLGWLSSTSLAQALWKLWMVQFIRALAAQVYSVFFQKLEMFDLDPIDFVGGPVQGLTALVTGPTSGIGTETAAALARRGAKVILACRSVERGEKLKSELESSIVALGHKKPDLEVWQLDLASLKSVRAFTQKWQAQKRPLHILVNNAGIYAMSASQETTEDGFEAHLAANHLGHFLLTMSLLSSLRQGTEYNPSFGARIVNVSSSLHMLVPGGMRISDPHFARSGSYNSQTAYAQSKLAQVLFTRELRRRLGPRSKIQVFAAHPGMVLTNVVRSLPGVIRHAYWLIMSIILLTPAQGARASVYCATAEQAPKEGLATHGYFNAACKPVQPSTAAQDEGQALWLWRWSVDQVQLPKELDLPEPQA